MVQPADRPIRVLIVEDSEDDADLSLLELRGAGYAPEHERVEDAASLSAALGRGPWDVLLCDHNLPRFDAPEALRIVRERDQDLPFLIVSSCVGEALVAQLMRAGATDYVPKDDLGWLGAAVDRALRESAMRRERRRAEEALRESEERFALAVEGSRDGLWEINFLTRSTYYSPRLREMLGMEGGDIQGDPAAILGFVIEEDRERISRAFQDHIERRAPYEAEVRMRSKGGEIRWYNSRGQARWDGSGKPTRMAGSLSDITDRRRAEEALREQLALVQAQQQAIRELSTPIIEVWDGVLTLPVLGALDARRAAEMMEALLAAVVQRACRHVILDLTGVAALDAATADHVLKIVRAVELLGARGIVVGIQPSVAQSMVGLGVDLSRITTLSTLRSALLFCMRQGAGR